MGAGFAAGVVCGLLVAGGALVAASLAVGDLPGTTPPGGVQLGVDAVPAAPAEPDPALAPSDVGPTATSATAIGAAGLAEAAPDVQASPGAPAAAEAPALAAPSRGPEGDEAPGPTSDGASGGDPDAVLRSVPVLPAAPEAGDPAPEDPLDDGA